MAGSCRPRTILAAGLDARAWRLPYLPAEGQDMLLERIHDLSVRASRVAVEAFGASEERTEVADLLTGHGWEVTTIAAADLMDRYGRCAAGEADDSTPRTVFVAGRLPI